MEKICGLSLQCSTWIAPKSIGVGSNGLVPIGKVKVTNFSDCLQPEHKPISRQARYCLEISNSDNSSQAPTLEPRNCNSCLDARWLLKTKGKEVSSRLGGQCIYLVGMMGSGKTTVGKILSEALGYSFVDSDSYVEKAMGGISVAQIFSQYGESFFRDYESEALQKLSLMRCKVVATGGGVVIRAINWKYMKRGISVYLNVPLDALAKRIAAAGNSSRPLLDDSGDAYTKMAFLGLFPISKKRANLYANADITISLSDLAANSGGDDVLDITPSAIATEVLLQIEKFLGGTASQSLHMLP